MTSRLPASPTSTSSPLSSPPLSSPPSSSLASSSVPSAAVAVRERLSALDVLGVVLAFGGGLAASFYLAFSSAYLAYGLMIFVVGAVSAMLVRRGRGWLVSATAVWLAMEVVQVIYGAQHSLLTNAEWWLEMVMIGLLIYAFAALPSLVGATIANRFFGTRHSEQSR